MSETETLAVDARAAGLECRACRGLYGGNVWTVTPDGAYRHACPVVIVRPAPPPADPAAPTAAQREATDLEAWVARRIRDNGVSAAALVASQWRAAVTAARREAAEGMRTRAADLCARYVPVYERHRDQNAKPESQLWGRYDAKATLAGDLAAAIRALPVEA